jgi:type IV pilus assembly protein PilW
MNTPTRSLQTRGALARARQGGFTLVELMISMVLGLFIVLALLTLLINVNRNNGELSKANRVIENGRFALQLLETDVSHAGFLGGFVPQFDDLSATTPPTDVPTVLPDPCPVAWAGGTTTTFATPTYVANLIGIPLQAYEISSPVPTPTLTVCASHVLNPQPNTDVLFVRHLDTAACIAGAAGCPASAGDLYFQMNHCWDSSSPGYSTTTYVFATTTTAFTLNQGSCTAASAGTRAELRKYVSSLYYVRNYEATPGDGVPTLVRAQFGLSGGVLQYQAEQALIEGIEGFRVEFGVDNVSATGAAVSSASYAAAPIFPNTALLVRPSNRGDGYPDGAAVHCTTLAPCTVDQMMNAVVVKIYVLVRSEEKSPNYTDSKTYALGSTPMGPFNDGYKRHLFTQTIRLTNISMRRETP